MYHGEDIHFVDHGYCHDTRCIELAILPLVTINVVEQRLRAWSNFML